MPTLLPEDDNSNPIPALGLVDGGAHTISTADADTPVRNVTAFGSGTRVVSIYSDQDIYIRFGDETVVASNTDHFFPGGLYYDFSIGGGSAGHKKFLSVLAVTNAGTTRISEKA